MTNLIIIIFLSIISNHIIIIITLNEEQTLVSELVPMCIISNPILPILFRFLNSHYVMTMLNAFYRLQLLLKCFKVNENHFVKPQTQSHPNGVKNRAGQLRRMKVHLSNTALNFHSLSSCYPDCVCDRLSAIISCVHCLVFVSDAVREKYLTMGVRRT